MAKTLIIRGATYDITSFSKIHPGGNVITFYDGLDATDAFDTFHVHSKKANLMLNSLRIKAIDVIESESSFTTMVQSWKDQGLYHSNYYEFFIWGGVVSMITFLGLWLQMLGYPICGGIITGVGWGQCGFVQHHAGHLGFTGNPRVDHVVQDFFEGFLKGGSASWWRNRHNKHHAMPNSIGYDGDLRTTPFFAWDDVLVNKVPSFLLRVQHILIFPAMLLYVPLFLVTTKLFMIRKKKWYELSIVGLHHVCFGMFCRNIQDFLLFYGLGYSLQGLYLGIMFSINHMAMPRIDNVGDDWFDRQLISTCNWGTNSKIALYASGFLNLQIEHHIAPQMPPEHYMKISKDIQKLAKEKSIPYRNYTFWDGLVLFVQTLKDTADKELNRRRSKEKQL